MEVMRVQADSLPEGLPSIRSSSSEQTQFQVSPFHRHSLAVLGSHEAFWGSQISMKGGGVQRHHIPKPTLYLLSHPAEVPGRLASHCKIAVPGGGCAGALSKWLKLPPRVTPPEIQEMRFSNAASEPHLE